MNKQRWRVLLVCVAALTVTGCLQIETTISLHEDGSATITERMQFSRQLLEFRDKEQPELNVAALLEKPRILERMKHMGKEITLVSHKVQDGERGSRESISVFKIPKVEDFRYVSPFFGKGDYAQQNAMTCRIWPQYDDRWTGMRGGHMYVEFRSESKNVGDSNPRGVTPEGRQLYRQLKPMFEDMLQDFQIKFVFESYAPLHVHGRSSGGQRGSGTRTHRAHLIDISGENLGGGGRRFIANEEAMADVLQGFINGPHAKANTGFGATSQLFRFSNGGTVIGFRPSKYYFDKYFKGKKVKYDLGFGRTDHRLADFKREGYTPPTNGEEKKK